MTTETITIPRVMLLRVIDGLKNAGYISRARDLAALLNPNPESEVKALEPPSPTPQEAVTTDNLLLTFAKGHAQAGLVDCAAASADDALREWVAKGHYVEHSDAFLAVHASRDAEVESLRKERQSFEDTANIRAGQIDYLRDRVTELTAQLADAKSEVQLWKDNFKAALEAQTVVAAERDGQLDRRLAAEASLTAARALLNGCSKHGNYTGTECIGCIQTERDASRTLADELAGALAKWEDFPHVILPHCDKCAKVSDEAMRLSAAALARYRAQKEAR